MSDAHPPRRTALADHHLALGGALDGEWNGMGVVRGYAADPFDEVLAVRTRAGLLDISAHRMIDVRGPDAVAVLDRMLACDVATARPGTAQGGGLLDDEGGLIDDLLVTRCGDAAFRLSHGSGGTAAALAQAAHGADVEIAPDHDGHLLSVQGPFAEAILASHTPADLASLGYFNHTDTTLFGIDVRMMRGGYSGEAGFEIECGAATVGEVWDAILAAGAPMGLRPAGWTCLETLRIEAGLLFYPFEMPHPHTTPWEVGIGWAIAQHKPAFRGRAAVLAAQGKERSRMTGIDVDHHAAVPAGAIIRREGREIGVVTSAVFSRYLMRSIALAAIAPDACMPGTPIEVVANEGTLRGHVSRIPFYDPLHLRTHPRAAA